MDFDGRLQIRIDARSPHGVHRALMVLEDGSGGDVPVKR